MRWFRLGPLSFQPSELAKFALILYLAVLLSRNAERVRAFSMGFLPPLLMTGVVIGPDGGAAGPGDRAHPGRGHAGAAVRVGRAHQLPGAGGAGDGAGGLEGADHRQGLAHEAHAGVPRALATLPERRLPAVRVADQRRLGRHLGPGAGGQPPEAVLPARGAHRLHPGHHRRGAGAGGGAGPAARLRAAVLAGHRGGAARARRVRQLPGVRHHLPVRPAGAGQHGRGAGPAADQGSGPALHQLRRHLAGGEPVHGGRAGQHLGARARAAPHPRVPRAPAPPRPRQEPPRCRRARGSWSTSSGKKRPRPATAEAPTPEARLDAAAGRGRGTGGHLFPGWRWPRR